VIVLVLLGCAPAPVEDPVPPWPEWAFEHWVWEDQSTQASVIAQIDGYLDRGIPVGAVIVDSPWASGYSTFEWDTSLFPDPQGLIDDIHARGVKLILWTVPGMNTDVPELYAVGAERGYYMQRDADSGPARVEWWKGEGSLLDYGNPEAVAWWHSLQDPAIAMGVDGWKADGLDFSQILAPYSPSLGRRLDRLDYSHRYYRDHYEHLVEERGEDVLVTARPVDAYGADVGGDVAAFAPLELGWAGWVGDQDGTFAGLEAALRNYYWSADYGYTAFGSDIGGYREDGSALGRTEEVLLRWAWLGACSPVMENGGGGAHEPWRFSEDAVAVYRDAVLFHTALVPYLRREGAVAFAEGRSLFAFDSHATFVYTLGPDLLVAPIFEAGTSFEVRAPRDGESWRWLFDPGVVVGSGERVTLEVPLDRYPVFVRVGSRLEEELLGSDGPTWR
jgi:alpha-glucosidase (family GH31 glycosyl hydrolase)